MKCYRVAAFRVSDNSLVDDALIDNYEEAYDLMLNWQDYYDDSDEEINVCVGEFDCLYADLKGDRNG